MRMIVPFDRMAGGDRFARSAPEAARKLARMGTGNDELLAHITPAEAMLLKLLGGSGSINPKTGVMSFDNSDAAGGQEGGPGGPTGGAGDPGGYGNAGDTGGGSGADIGNASGDPSGGPGGYGYGGYDHHGNPLAAFTPGWVDVLDEAFGGPPAGPKGAMSAIAAGSTAMMGPAAGLIGLGMLGTAGLQALTGGAGIDAGEGLNAGDGGQGDWGNDAEGAARQQADARAAADAAAASEAARARAEADLAAERDRLRRRARGRSLLISGTERGFGAGVLSGAA